MAGAKLRNVLCHISNLVATQQAEGSPLHNLRWLVAAKNIHQVGR